MGSFLSPFLHHFPRAEVRHLCQPPKAISTRDFCIRRTTVPDDLLEPGKRRPAIELEPAPEEVGSGRYRITADPHDWLDRAGSGPALLHIDMDYFCNRFDGDTDWRTRPHSLDANLDIILSKIDEMAAALRQRSEEHTSELQSLMGNSYAVFSLKKK